MEDRCDEVGGGCMVRGRAGGVSSSESLLDLDGRLL